MPATLTTNNAVWRTKTQVTEDDRNLARECQLSPVLIAILRQRGFEDIDAVRAFLQPQKEDVRDPFLLPDIEPAIELLHQAITEKQPMLLFGDYDVDGVTSTALLFRSLQRLGANVEWSLPERADGYGLNDAVIKDAHQRGIKLVVTVDCGITAHQQADLAKELGVDLIISDHHQSAAELPQARAVIDPKRADSQYGFEGLSGCAVAYKLMQALLARYWPQYLPSFTQNYLDLVALAGIADCVPLQDENRYLCHAGLKVLSRTRKKGLRALMDVCRIDTAKRPLAGYHVGFQLGPRLNASGRMASPKRSLELLLCADDTQSQELATELNEINLERQQATRQIIKEAQQRVYKDAQLQNQHILVVEGNNWPHGLIGLAASRLVERFSRPAIVIGIENGQARGSGRSYADFDLHSLIEETQHLLIGGGGHKAACGLSIDIEKIDEFREAAQEFAREHLDAALLVPLVEADCATDAADITPELAAGLQALEPCGTGNPEAQLMLKNAVLVDGYAMGKEKQHLKWYVESGGIRFECVWWNPGSRADGFEIGHTIDFCYVPGLNTWRGNTTLQLQIKGVRHSAGDVARSEY